MSPEKRSDLGEHIRNVVMQDGYTRRSLADPGVKIRIIHRVLDISVIKIILKFLHRHNCTVVFRLLGRRAEVR